MTDNEETLTITVKRLTLEMLFAGGNYCLAELPLSANLALNVIDHAAWLTSLIARGGDEEDERNHYADQQLTAVRDLILAVAAAEKSGVAQ